MKEKTVGGILEEVAEEICKDYCKWPTMWDEEKHGELWLSEICEQCPLRRL